MVVLHVCVHGWLVVIVGGRVICWALIVVVRVRGRSLVVVGGGHYGRSSPFLLCMGGGRGRSLAFVDGGGMKKGSHVTHRDNGITFEHLREITCE